MRRYTYHKVPHDHVYICVVNRRFLSGKSTYVDVIVRYFVIRLTAHSCTRHGLLQNMHNDVRSLIYMFVLIPEYNLTYRTLPCNSVDTSFRTYIRDSSPYSLMSSACQVIFRDQHDQIYQWPYTIMHVFAIIHVLYMNAPLDVSQSTSRSLHMWIYQTEIDG